MIKNLISLPRTIIPACDVELDKFEELIEVTANIEKVGAYKIGFSLALQYGLPKIVNIVRKYTAKPIIYDHQKAGTDIPDTGNEFVKTVKEAGIDAIIIFPLAGPATQTAWIHSAQMINLPVIVGGYMTHERFLSSEGGYIDDTAIEKIYSNAGSLGVNHFVVPGNKPNVIKETRSLLLKLKIEPVFYAPGFISQGGDISEAANVAGPHWHAIVGRAIYEARDIAQAAESLIKHI